MEERGESAEARGHRRPPPPTRGHRRRQVGEGRGRPQEDAESRVPRPVAAADREIIEENMLRRDGAASSRQRPRSDRTTRARTRSVLPDCRALFSLAATGERRRGEGAPAAGEGLALAPSLPVDDRHSTSAIAEEVDRAHLRRRGEDRRRARARERRGGRLDEPVAPLLRCCSPRSRRCLPCASTFTRTSPPSLSTRASATAQLHTDTEGGREGRRGG